MKHTVTLPSFLAGRASGGGDVFLLTAWHKEIGEAVQAGDTLVVVRAGDDPEAKEQPVVSPAFGILSRKIVLPGEAIESGEPLAILSGVPESLLSEGPIPDAFAARPPYLPGGPEEVVSLSPVRRAVAEHMARSWTDSPHVFTVAGVDVSEAMRLATRRDASALTPFVLAAVAGALRRHPALNAERVGDDQVRRKQYVHVGLARPTPSGDLTLLVLRDADRRSVRALSREIEEGSEQRRRGTLPETFRRGATFTLLIAEDSPSGIRFQTPILHQPQAALLRMGAVERVPVALPDDQIAVRPILQLCLAHDARLVTDGEAAAFLADVKTEIEEARFLFA